MTAESVMYSENLNGINWNNEVRKSGETILHKICHPRHVQTQHLNFYYNVLKITFDNVELLGQDAGSFIVQLNDQGNNIHKMCDMYKSFDFSELDNTSYFC